MWETPRTASGPTGLALGFPFDISNVVPNKSTLLTCESQTRDRGFLRMALNTPGKKIQSPLSALIRDCLPMYWLYVLLSSGLACKHTHFHSYLHLGTHDGSTER